VEEERVKEPEETENQKEITKEVENQKEDIKYLYKSLH
jgi:hypothetical protein